LLRVHAGEFTVAMTTSDDVSNLTRGDNATLECRVRGDVTADVTVTWSRDGELVVDGGRSVTAEDGRRLTLYDLSPDDSGEYTCEATRRLQQADASINVTVHGRLVYTTHYIYKSLFVKM